MPWRNAPRYTAVQCAACASSLRGGSEGGRSRSGRKWSSWATSRALDVPALGVVEKSGTASIPRTCLYIEDELAKVLICEGIGRRPQ